MSLATKLCALLSPLLLTQCSDPSTSVSEHRIASSVVQPQWELAASQLVLDYSSLATATDQGPQDGVFDSFTPANLGSVNNNGYTSLRTAFEFSLASIPPNATIDAAVVTVRLYNDPGISSLQLHGYSGDGAVALGDFARDGPVATFSAGTWGQFFQLDVSTFIAGLITTGSPYAGFNVREQPANGSNATVMGLDVTAWRPVLTVTYSTERTVRIDIKPGDDINSINVRSRGRIPVAVLGEATLDVTDIDPTLLTFGRTGGEASLAFCNKMPTDVNGDGFPDLLCHFDVEGSAFLANDTQGVLTGMTRTGVRIRGSDAIRTVP